MPAAAAALILVALAPLIWNLLPGKTYATTIAEVRDIALSDGSRITLGARSRVDLVFSDTQRRVRLTGGEAFFDVEKDATRPFVVEAGEAVVRVLGTRFNVRRGVSETNVAVLDGTVEVLRDRDPPQRLQASQQITLRQEQTTVVTSIEPATPVGVWRSGRLSYDGTPLVEVIADVNRYYPAGITLAEASLADLKVTTALEVSQIGQMIDSLAAALPIVVERRSNGHVVLAPKP